MTFFQVKRRKRIKLLYYVEIHSDSTCNLHLCTDPNVQIRWRLKFKWGSASRTYVAVTVDQLETLTENTAPTSTLSPETTERTLL